MADCRGRALAASFRPWLPLGQAPWLRRYPMIAVCEANGLGGRPMLTTSLATMALAVTALFLTFITIMGISVAQGADLRLWSREA